jgi:hypothetical protein
MTSWSYSLATRRNGNVCGLQWSSSAGEAMRSRHTWGVAVATFTGLVTLSAPASAEAKLPSFCSGTAPIPATSLQAHFNVEVCQIIGRPVSGARVSAPVPAPGESYEASIIVPAGVGATAEQLTVRTDRAGDVTVVDRLDQDTILQASSPPPTDNPCADAFYDSQGMRESDNHRWYFNQSTVPTRNGVTNVTNAIIAAANNMSTGYNNCGYSGAGLSSQQTYMGNTTLRANLSNSGDCWPAGRDGNNIINFGTLPGDTLAQACVAKALNEFGWDEIQEADIKINDGKLWDVGPTGCDINTEHDVENVLTHEWGHAFGLADVSASSHPSLTMKGSSYFCERRGITLAKGDFLGMDHIY